VGREEARSDPHGSSGGQDMGEHQASVTIGVVTIEVREGDITQADTAAITNAANPELWMGVGVAGAIKRAGGPQIEREAMAQGPIAPGQAVATSAGELPHQAVLHGAALRTDGTTDAQLIRATTLACLELAAARGWDSLALPALGTGVAGFPLEPCARTMVETALEFARTAPRSLRRILFVLYGVQAYEIFAQTLQTSAGGPPGHE
jgi:O-acetyl-ADP-ribose deacetylase